MSNYPPGVTGDEYAISGPDYEHDVPDRECLGCGLDNVLLAQGHGRSHWFVCTSCDYIEELED